MSIELKAIEWRHHIHQHPEFGTEEHQGDAANLLI